MNINSCRWSNFSRYKITMGANPVVNRISPFDELSALATDRNLAISKVGEFRRFAPLFALDQLQRGLDIDISIKQGMTGLLRLVFQPHAEKILID